MSLMQLIRSYTWAEDRDYAGLHQPKGHTKRHRIYCRDFIIREDAEGTITLFHDDGDNPPKVADVPYAEEFFREVVDQSPVCNALSRLAIRGSV